MEMKKILILIAVLAVVACSQKEESFKIKVELEGAEGKVLLEKPQGPGLVPVDTAEIVDGVAVLEGEVEYPRDLYLSVLGQRPKTIIFVENSDMTVKGHVDSLQNVEVTGSEAHDQYQEINRQISDVSKQYMQLYQEARQAAAMGDTAKADQLMEEVNRLYESTVAMQEDFVRNNSSSYVAPYVLSRIQHGMEVEKLDTLVLNLDSKMDSLQAVQILKERIQKLKSVAVGQKAPDFSMEDTDGNMIKFSDIYSQNELTLLDFWAAWCGPCRQENPNVVGVYKEFSDKGFGVFGVSLDREKEAWLKAIEDDQLTWPHVSDLQYWNNEAAKIYAVNSIPSSLLVDKNGIIVAKNKRGPELRTTVDQLLD